MVSETNSPGGDMGGEDMATRERFRMGNLIALPAIAVAALLLGGCSASTPAPPTNAQKTAVMTFDLSKCQATGDTGLYKCPEIDKPICDPSFARADVECVRVTANHTFVYAPGE
jgi:PBP1b-binding outer membrane lipoprotein LpoB